MSAINWDINPGILGLCFLSIAPGVGGDGTATAKFPQRAMTEVAAVSVISVLVSKSWWPLAAPVAYFTWDYLWNKMSDEAKTDTAPDEIWSD